MVASIFQTFIVQPIFNLLIVIYALIPGHNFGFAIIIFTVLVRLLMWPVIKKQLHQAKAMRQLQPEIKKVKKAAKGDRQKESVMLMELYKERKINPFGSIGTLIIQLIVLLGLYQGLRKVVANPHALIDSAYPFVRSLSWLKTLAGDIHRFDPSLFGIVNLDRAALKSGQAVYIPAMILVLGSAVSQYFQSKQLMPTDKDARGLRAILKEASSGKAAEQGEVNAAVGRTTRYFIPVMIFLFTVNLAAALSLYWFVSGLTAYIQQARILGQDETEMEAIADEPEKKELIEGEVVEVTPSTKKVKKTVPTKKRRKR
ncbi:MAG: hypothetical protein NVS3B23_02180 [Candidatus Saccharimonadales bacterium]